MKISTACRAMSVDRKMGHLNHQRVILPSTDRVSEVHGIDICTMRSPIDWYRSKETTIS